jgi:hypothetical protein
LRRGLCLLFSAAALAGCGSSSSGGGHHGAPTHVASAARRLRRLRALLPPGFAAPGRPVTPGAAGTLQVEPDPSLRAGGLHLARLPSRAAVAAALLEITDDSRPTLVRPLFLSGTSVAPSGSLTVAATQLGSAARHDSLFVLAGPNRRYQRLVQVRGRVSAGVVKLPAGLTKGTWYLAAVDLSAPQILVDLAQLRVS